MGMPSYCLTVEDQNHAQLNHWKLGTTCYWTIWGHIREYTAVSGDPHWFPSPMSDGAQPPVTPA